MKEENAALCRALSSLTGVSVSPIYPDSPEQFYDEACAARFCRECPYQQKNEFNTHLYGLSEAYRWDGHFIYYCPKAMVFVAAAILDGSGSLGGGMIAGPIVMGDIQDITCYTEYPYSRSTIEQLPRMTTLQVRQLALLLSASASSLHHSSFEQKRSYDQQQFLNAIYDMRSKEKVKQKMPCFFNKLFCVILYILGSTKRPPAKVPPVAYALSCYFRVLCVRFSLKYERTGAVRPPPPSTRPAPCSHSARLKPFVGSCSSRFGFA